MCSFLGIQQIRHVGSFYRLSSFGAQFSDLTVWRFGKPGNFGRFADLRDLVDFNSTTNTTVARMVYGSYTFPPDYLLVSRSRSISPTSTRSRSPPISPGSEEIHQPPFVPRPGLLNHIYPNASGFYERHNQLQNSAFHSWDTTMMPKMQMPVNHHAPNQLQQMQWELLARTGMFYSRLPDLTGESEDLQNSFQTVA